MVLTVHRFEQVHVSPFAYRVSQEGIHLTRDQIATVQINVGRRCNQSCLHCHVEAGPQRPEVMPRAIAELALELVHATGAQTVDLTGGAPELNPSFRWLVEQSVRNGWHVIDRCNLTVLLEPELEDLAAFMAEHRVEIVASLPCYTQENVDAQRGAGVYAKSMQVLRHLNALGYGKDGSGLILNLVYNPLGAFLPSPQSQLEVDYRRELWERFGITFNRLFTLTNVPLGRFATRLASANEYDAYWTTLSTAFNPATLSHLMCRSMISLSWDGYIYDCDFNQVLGQRLGDGKPFHLGDLPMAEIVKRLATCDIIVGLQCYACAAGSGSSCQGALQ